jgi:hypothetical protein
VSIPRHFITSRGFRVRVLWYMTYNIKVRPRSDSTNVGEPFLAITERSRCSWVTAMPPSMPPSMPTLLNTRSSKPSRCGHVCKPTPFVRISVLSSKTHQHIPRVLDEVFFHGTILAHALRPSDKQAAPQWRLCCATATTQIQV